MKERYATGEFEYFDNNLLDRFDYTSNIEHPVLIL